MTKQTNKLVQGHGVNDFNGPVKINGRPLKFYITWSNMLQRCYSEKSMSRHPTYRNCSVCDSWLSLTTFKEWFDTNYREGMSLDKDILIQGNKVYSPERCRFVPQYINSLLCDAGAIRGELPLGVVACYGDIEGGIGYRAFCNGGHGKRMPSKTFKTIPEAAAWYSMTKKKVVKDIVLDAFWRNEIMSDVATALLEREW